MRSGFVGSYTRVIVLGLAIGCDEAVPPELVIEPPLVDPVTFTSIAAGGMHTCALGADSLAYCWGHNSSGELGDGTTTDPPIPVPVAGRLRFVALAAGSTHSCGLTPSGAGYCWGADNKGQLGGGVPTDRRTTPVPVAGNLIFAHIVAGAGHTCALSTEGQAWCWGDNGNGRLGDGTTEARPAPALVIGGLRFSSLAAGDSHTCGVSADGQAYCWGDNVRGALGDSSLAQRTTPVPVRGGIAFASLSAGRTFTCGHTAAGQAYCWGSNSSSTLGDGRGCDPRQPYYPCAELYRTTPGPVAGTLSFAYLSTGYSFACAVTTDGAGYCWGGNASGYLGTGSTSMYEAVPRPVTGGLVLSQIAAASSHACALTLDGNAYCWGGAGFGIPVLGNASTPVSSYVPVPVTMPLRAR